MVQPMHIAGIPRTPNNTMRDPQLHEMRCLSEIVVFCCRAGNGRGKLSSSLIAHIPTRKTGHKVAVDMRQLSWPKEQLVVD